jgi:membrane associated rhomboid family serine protease
MNNLTVPIFSRYTVTEDKADDWSLVLTALDIAHEVAPRAWGWQVMVSPDDKERAESEITAYEGEDIAVSAFELVPPFAVNYYSTFVVSVLVLVFHGLTASYDGRIDFFGAGHASSKLIQDGQWWRSVTALTLHGDIFHAISNVILGSIFAIALFRQVGAGLGWFLILFTGVAGNLCNAFLYDSPHRAIGASTAVFGAMGLVAALQFFIHKQARLQKAWAPLGAALALLGFLGTSEGSDMLAHLLGFVCGVFSGALCGAILKRTGVPSMTVQRALAALSVVCVVYSWLLAFEIR